MPIMCQTNVVRVHSSYVFEIHFNIPPTPRSSKWYLSVRFLKQNAERTFLLSSSLAQISVITSGDEYKPCVPLL
jgi:hypothetical protein